MLKSERQNEIIEILNTRGFVSVTELSALLYASESSIRRDLARLEERGIVKRSYGGAECILSGSHVLPFDTRNCDFVEEKNAIAKKALTLIKEGDVIFLDQSSTSYFLALYLRNYKDITVVTNNIEIVSLLSKTNVTVHCTGGIISKNNTNCLIGGSAQSAFERVFADVAFFSAHGSTSDGGIVDCTDEETHLRASMFKNAAKKVFLCNSAKLDRRAPFVQCDLSAIDVLVCEDASFKKFGDRYPRLTVL